MLGDIGILFLLVLLNGLFAASEMALVSVNKNKVKLLAEQGDKNAAMLLTAIDNPSNFLATVQIGVSLIGLLSGALAADNFANPIVNLIMATNINISQSLLKTIVFFLITFLLSYFMLILGELVPKRIALKKSIQLALLVIPFLNFLSVLTRPFVKLLAVTSDLVLKILRFDFDERHDDITKEELRMIVETGIEHGSIDETENDMIQNIFEFDSKNAEDVCIHRVDVVALPIDAELSEIIEVAADLTYSRIPVYEETIDNILGILYVKDLMKHLVKDSNFDEFNLKDSLRQPFFVPFSKKTDELFEEMRKKRVHMAVVIDEYGGTLGIITLEDLVEEIMGNIFDEHDALESPEIERIGEDVFRIQGTTDLEMVEEIFDISLPTEDYDTLSGFLVGELGHIPQEGETADFVFKNVSFRIESVTEKRIGTVIVSKIDTSNESKETNQTKENKE